MSQAEKARVIQTLLFTSGLSTLFQTLFGTRLPSVAVGSYAYMIPTTSIVLASRHTSCLDNDVVKLRTLVFLFISIDFYCILVLLGLFFV
jgi:nucleobase transporter 1/2